jgi:hypothetical protein
MASASGSGDWPHDPDSDEGSEGMRKYGLAIVAKKVDEDEDFPLSVSEFREEYGDDPVRINHRRVVSVADVLEYVDADEFEDKVAFNRGVGDAMRRGGFWDYTPEN